MAKSLNHRNNKYRLAIHTQLNRVTAELLILQHAYTTLVAEEAAFSADLLQYRQSITDAANRFYVFRRRSRNLLHQLKESEKRKRILEGVLKVMEDELF